MLKTVSILAFFVAMQHGVLADAAPQDQKLYVTRQDCRQLVAHHPDSSVEYKPGVDVHGHYVAPADLPSSNPIDLPDKVTFDLRLNPLAYAPQAKGNAPPGAFLNTETNLGHVEVDLKSGATRFNGRSLDDEQTRIITDACRQAGYR
jgi:hypothetical protein